MGDALSAFNPIYGQGMSVAAAEAVVLDRCLTEHWRTHLDGDIAGLGRSYLQGISTMVSNVWLLATSEDLRFPTTEGTTPGLQTRLMHRYVDRLLQVATEDRSVNRAFGDVVNLVAEPSSLFRPEILWRVARGQRTVSNINQLPAPFPADELQPVDASG